MDGRETGTLKAPSSRAPGGLALVQDLVNTATRPAEAPSPLGDALATEDSANQWLSAALSAWADATGQPAPALNLGESDLQPLRRLREAVRALAEQQPGAEHDEGRPRPAPPGATSVALHFGDDGRVHYGTAATGWRGVASLVATEILLAQRTGTWERFKACPYEGCGVTFFDHTRNNNRVWHDVRICGNRTNLVASRQRKRDRESSAV